MKLVRNLLLLILLLILAACSLNKAKELEQAGFTKPVYVEGELIVNVKVDKVLSGQELKDSNISKGIPEDRPPMLRLWSSAISERTNQKEVKNISCEPKPTEVFKDKENNNEILYWELSDKIKDGAAFTVKRKFSYITYDYKPNPCWNIIDENWGSIPEDLKKFYTKEESYLEITPEIRAKAKEIVGKERGKKAQYELIFSWIRKNMKYKYPPEKRGAVEAFKTLEGDCGQYAFLYIVLCRALELPVRFQAGFVFVPDKISYHVWNEIYLPPYGWIPVDTTKDDGFCHLDNERLIASDGTNIPIPNVPKWATYEKHGMENGRTDFMQLVSDLQSGFEGSVQTERKILKYEERY